MPAAALAAHAAGPRLCVDHWSLLGFDFGVLCIIHPYQLVQ